MRVLLFALPLVLLPLSSIALETPPGDKSFTIDSRPTGALVFINGSEVGTTPFRYNYDRMPDVETSFELRMEGYHPLTIDLVGILKDSRARAKPLTVNLHRDHSVAKQRVDLPVVTLINAIPASKKEFGVKGPSKLKRDSDELHQLDYPDQLTSAVISAFRGSFASAMTARKATQKGDEAIRKARFYLQPVLKDLRFDVTAFDHHVYGDVRASMEWKMMSGNVTDSMLFSIETETTWQACRDHENSMLDMVIREAAHQFIDDEGLHEKLRTITSTSIAAGKGEVVELIKPTGIKFDGRKDMLAKLVKGVVTIKTKDGHGSGFLIASDGYIITNAHVVKDQGTVTVKFNQGFTLDGQVVKVNRDFDLALIKTAGEDLPAMVLGDDTELLVGEELFAIGTPLDEELGQTVTRGIMSGRREFEGRTFIQTDVSINAGNSGGPVIDEKGKVVGVATLKVSDSGVQGIGFAVPVGKMVEMLNLKFK